MKSKAIFLLVIFLLNTVVGLGPVLGIERNHNAESYYHKKSTAHEHKNHGFEHEHKITPELGQNFTNGHPRCKIFKTLVSDLVTQSKLVPEIAKVQVVLPVMWLPDYSYNLLVPVTDVELGRSVYADRRERPPNKDIRIVIQSFQI